MTKRKFENPQNSIQSAKFNVLPLPPPPHRIGYRIEISSNVYYVQLKKGRHSWISVPIPGVGSETKYRRLFTIV